MDDLVLDGLVPTEEDELDFSFIFGHCQAADDPVHGRPYRGKRVHPAVLDQPQRHAIRQ